LCDKDLALKIVTPGAIATHFLGSVVSVITKSRDWEKHARHENNHNLEEMFAGAGSFYAESLMMSLTHSLVRLNRLKELGAPLVIITTEKKNFKKRISKYCHSNFHEIIADIDNLDDREINTFWVNFGRVLDLMETFVEQVEDLEMKELIKDSLIEMEENFAEILIKIGRMFFAAKELGDVDKAKAALILFQTERIDKALKYLSWHFGPQFDFLTCLRPVLQQGAYFSVIEFRMGWTLEQSILSQILGEDEILGRAKSFELRLAKEDGFESFWSLKNIRQLSVAVDNGTNLQLPDKEKEKFSTFFDNPAPEVILALSNDDFVELVQKVVFIAKRLDFPKLSSFVLGNVSYQFFAGKVYRAIDDDDFTKPLDLFKRWPFGLKVFLDVLEQDDGDFIGEYFKKTGMELTAESLRDSKIGKFYQNLGQSELMGKLFQASLSKNQ